MLFLCFFFRSLCIKSTVSYFPAFGCQNLTQFNRFPSSSMPRCTQANPPANQATRAIKYYWGYTVNTSHYWIPSYIIRIFFFFLNSSAKNLFSFKISKFSAFQIQSVLLSLIQQINMVLLSG